MKHAGDPVAAAALADEARSMDLADRFLNSECVKRMLQADQVFANNTESVCLYESLELDYCYTYISVFQYQCVSELITSLLYIGRARREDCRALYQGWRSAQ